MSASAVEAKSLSSLTALASNPPAYPRNPTQVKHEPLTLYIARVPGSKDVFLSPMKPREKVVTAEDIQSSLYFVHVETPEDARLIIPPDYQQFQAYSTPSPVGIIQRKAVPGTSTGLPTTALARKPIQGALAPMNNFADRNNVSAGTYSQRPRSLAAEYGARRSFDSNQRHLENERPTASPRRASENPVRNGTILTLIRRDPASGCQWNVARIEDPNIFEVSSAASIDPLIKKKTGSPMYIEILNPGYSKFLHSDTASSNIASFAPGSDIPTHSSIHLSSQPEGLSTASQNIFRRRLWMEGMHHDSAGFGHRKKTSQDYYDNLRPDSRGGNSSRGELSTGLVGPQPSPSFLQRQDQAYGTIQVSDRQTSFRGYVFSSPWNGRCEFVTGVGGGSLKCRHIVPGLQGVLPTAMTVSELRFNLPTRSKAISPDSSKRSSLFHRGRHSRTNSSKTLSCDGSTEDDDCSSDRLDLSLGQEFAGGGFGGKQAKLGKIIMEDEGLKMMDLLMAANIGLWWRAYERASVGSR